jgi:uncharacterized membrane protein
MDYNIKIIILALSVLLTGLTAGLCFTWSNAVTPGIARLDTYSFLKAFQSMNRVIINGKFIIVFFGPVFLLILNAYLHKTDGLSFWLFSMASILFFVGVGLVTVFGNVPLNNLLEQTNLDSIAKTELQELRIKFEQPWNYWHTIRTLCSFSSFILLILGLIPTK